MLSVVVAPDKFAGSLTAPQVAAAFIEGWHSIRPRDRLLPLPLADGGPGFIDALSSSLPGETVEVPVTDPLRRPAVARCLAVGGTWYLESAQAAGLSLIALRDRDPSRATTWGVGLMIDEAVRRGATQIVVGLGGSATNDGGAGMLAALGAAGRDTAGQPVALDQGPAGFAQIAEVDLAPPRRRLAGLDVIIASDVDNPLTGPMGASRMFAAQKGASPSELATLDELLGRWATVCAEAGLPAGLSAMQGAGAAGGLGYGLLALGGRRRSGISVVLAAAGADRILPAADLVITGEGSFDEQSLHGKVVAGVVAAAGSTPVIVVAGRCSLAPDTWRAAGISRVITIAERAPSIDQAIARGADYVAAIAREVAVSISGL